MDLSIIICTYNPDREIFERVLHAVSRLNTDGLSVELVLVDNASKESVFRRFESELKAIPFSFIPVLEPKSGLMNARIAGFQASSGSILVCFDDDNEPEADYLQQVWQAFKRYPNVGVFGPGNITVEFTGNPPAWIHYNKYHFQERHYSQTFFACSPHWHDFFPPGTGQCLHRHLFALYLEKVQQGQLSATGRKGGSMASGEDVQIVFEAIKAGYAAGEYPDMRLRHLIAERKTSFLYLKRLVFGMASSYPEAYAECFPETRGVLPYFTNGQIFVKFWGLFWHRVVKQHSWKGFILVLSEHLGRIYASNHTRGGNTRSFWFWLIPLLKLK